MNNYRQKYLKLKTQLKYFPRTLHLIWNSSKWLLIFWLILLITLGILPALQIYLTKPLIDGLSHYTGKGVEQLGELYFPIALLGFTLLITPIFTTLLTWVRSVQAEKVQNSIRKKIQDKAISLEMSHFEQSSYYDRLHRAHVDAFTKPIAMLENLGVFFQNILTLLAILALLIPLGIWLPVILLFSLLPTLFVALKYTFKMHHWRINNTKNERKLTYFDHLLTNNEAAAEIRTFNLGKHFQATYWRLKHTLQRGYFALLRSQLKAEILGSIFSFMVFIFVILWIVFEALKGSISIGMLAMYYFAFTQGQRTVKTLFTNVSELYKNLMFLENLFEFLDIDIKKKKSHEMLPQTDNYTIEFQNVTFKYPNAQKNALNNISLTLRPNEIAAIVGTNGSGKSTLVKLINRFYTPSGGKILINQADITHIEPKNLRQHITVLFQNFLQYHLSVNDNISFGNIHEKDKKTSIIDAAENTGVADMVSKLPHNYETLLGRWFGGVELSGGEWQKIALSRAFLKNSKILILDEPTSAFDSWAEAKWLHKFKELCKNKTAMIITHRFTTARHADIIYVMDKGQIVESGSHEELLAQNGLYATSWQEQINEMSTKEKS